MNAGERFDADEVRLALRAQVHSVCAALGIEGRGRREIESQSCPRAQHNRRRSCVIDVRRGVWNCLACCQGGDMIDMVAAARGLDIRRQFGEVLAAAAALTGVRPVSADPFDAERRRAEVAARAAAERRRIAREEAEDAARQAEAIALAAATWPTLPLESERGEAYLRSRGLDPEPLRGHVRYPGDGIAVALHDRAGAVRNIVTRRYPELVTDEDDRKAIGRLACPSAGTLLGTVADLGEGFDVAVITEGVFDTIAAALTWPTCVALGAHGAGQMASVATVAARRLRELREAGVIRGPGALYIVPHFDDAGVREGIAAVQAARAEGLELDRDLHLVDLDHHNDLADALAAGWTWSWPM